MIYIGADHRGFELKEKIKQYLAELGHDVEDVGAFELNPDDDFVDFAAAAAQKVSQNPEVHRAILICRNAVGMDMTANKFKGIRATIGFDVEQVRLARNDDNINVLALPSDFVSEHQAKEIVDTFIDTVFEGHERQVRRLEKIRNLE